LNPTDKKLVKATFKGNRLSKVEFDWEKAAQVTAMKVHNEYLMVGHLDGSVQILFPSGDCFSTESLSEDWDFVRDIHLYESKTVKGIAHLSVLFVTNDKR
jgi:hypothetical protein